MNAVPLDEAELETLRKGARGAGLLVALSDRGFFDTFKEAGALAKHLAEAKKASDSPLIREVAEGAGTKFGMTDSSDEIERETVEALREGTRILQEKAPEAVDEYRHFVLELARSVSSAAGGGDEAEAAAIAKLEAAFAQAS